MEVSKHLFYGFILSLVLFPLIGLINSLLVFFSSFLIDVDHYLYYVYIKKDFSLRRAYYWFVENRKKYKKLDKIKKEKSRVAMLYFHGFETIILLFILGYFISFFNYIGIGFLFHIILDLFDQRKYQERIDKISILYDYYRYKKKLKRV